MSPRRDGLPELAQPSLPQLRAPHPTSTHSRPKQHSASLVPSQRHALLPKVSLRCSWQRTHLTGLTPASDSFQRLLGCLPSQPQTSPQPFARSANTPQPVRFPFRQQYRSVLSTLLNEARAQRAETVVKCFYDRIICRHGCPRRLLSDRGPQFKSSITEAVCLGILREKDLLFGVLPSRGWSSGALYAGAERFASDR